MSKSKISYRCSNCDHVAVKWAGCCPSCREWNSFSEEKIKPASSAGPLGEKRSSGSQVELFRLDQIVSDVEERLSSGIGEWDRVLGGQEKKGILPGSFLILTGDPGIGKSTLLLQVANSLARQGRRVLYFSSEESLRQVKNRASRLDVLSAEDSSLLFSDQANLDSIIATAEGEKPDLVIIDSIQNCMLSSSSSTIPGTISQLREAGFCLMRFAKENKVATIVTGHITKDGHIAGPKVLEHMVDGVFYLQGEDRWQTRILRSVKNRFGTIHEVGFFEMQEYGLKEVSNINEYLIKTSPLVDEGLSDQSDDSLAPGSVLVCSVEGSRPLLLELQALCVASKFNMPQRIVTGVDYKRVSLIAAILEKYLHVKLSAQDIFFKVSGGFSIKESASDLGIALALLSSYFQVPVPKRSIAVGEINLAGHVKPANHIDLRIKEAEKFGMTHFLGSKYQKISPSKNSTDKRQITVFKNIYELLKIFPDEK